MTVRLRSTADLARDAGVEVPCAGNLTQALTDPRYAWFVARGAVDLFLVETAGGERQSAPEHLLRAQAGRLLPNVGRHEEDTVIEVIAKGLPDTILRRIPVARLATARLADLAEQVETWVLDVCAMLSRDVGPWRPDGVVEAGRPAEAMRGVLTARRGVTWVPLAPLDATLYMGLVDPAAIEPDDIGEATTRAAGPGAEYFPLTPATWIDVTHPLTLAGETSQALAAQDLLLPALARFHAVAFALEHLNRRLALADDLNLTRDKATDRRADEEGARRRLHGLYEPVPDVEGSREAELTGALRAIGRHEGIDFKWPRADDDAATSLASVLDLSGVRGRRVRLPADERWWLGDAGALLAFRSDGRPVALLPGVLGRYREVDAASGRRTPVTAARARSIQEGAWSFHASLPPTGAGIEDLLGLACRGQAGNFVRLIVSGSLAALAALLCAVVPGFVIDRAIPAGEGSLLLVAVIAAMAAGVLGGLLETHKRLMLRQIEARAMARLEAAFWDRLLRLPMDFLHRYPAGELALRGILFRRLRDGALHTVADGGLSVIFMLPALAAVYFYDPMLGGVTTAMGFASVLVVLLASLGRSTLQARLVRALRRMVGNLHQLISGLSKLRVAGAEGTAFAVWARHYREQKEAERALTRRDGHLQAFATALPLLSGAVLVLAATIPQERTISTGDFVAVFLLFMLFESAVAKLARALRENIALMPSLEEIMPVLAEKVEVLPDQASVDILGGEVVFDHITFRYDPNGPAILDDVTIHARPGEFIAVTGESGVGKSTLFRIALGLAQPSSGTVYYDGRDLRQLDIGQLRRRIGAVPQHVGLHPDDLWDNIVGDREGVTDDDIQRVLRLAAVDREIAGMPMGMSTSVAYGAGLTSGGESQRIMIASALIDNPRVLLLDEASSWLDNDSQSAVMRNLAALSSTRIVIAHRVSTLREADRIYVLQGGKVVQTGAFDELAGVEGVFRDLIRRQMA